MRVVFSDLHGHVGALRALLAAEPGVCISAGDVLGPGGHNARCLELLAARGIRSVRGNHEVDLLPLYPGSEVVRGWPLRMADEAGAVVHTLIEDEAFWHVERPGDAIRLLSEARLVFYGHTHLPGWWAWDGRAEPVWHSALGPQRLDFEPGLRYAVNVGSLGEPLHPSHPRYVRWFDDGVEFVALVRSDAPGGCSGGWER